MARNAPITTAGSSTVCPGASFSIPVTVTNFSLIKGITLRLDFDPTKMTFVNYTNLNSSIASASINSVNVNPTLSKVIIAWADVTAKTLANGSKLMDLNFTLTSGSPVLTFNNTAGGGGECEYADEFALPMNDIPTSTYYFDATITNNAIGAAGTITGTTVLCAGTNNVGYTVPVITNATGYIWTVPSGGSIISGNNTRSIVVNYSTSAVSGDVTVKGTNSCGQGTPSTLAITVNPLPVPVITGAGAVCAGSTGVSYTTASGMTNYSWTITSGGNITTGATTNAILVNWNTAGTQNVTVTYTNANGCSAANPSVKTVTVNPLPAPTITGNNNVCVGATGVNYTTEASMSGYLWSVSSGGIIASGGTTNSILVNWNIVGPQSVSVNYTIPATGCSATSPASKAITVNPLPVPSITGPAQVCAGSAGNVYTTESGMTNYLWTVSAGGSISSGGGTSSNTVTVTWNATGAQSVSVNYTNSNTCTAASPVTKAITVNPLPAPGLTGPVSACNGSTGNVYTTETGMTNYLWAVSPGGNITAGGGTSNNTATVTWNGTTPQSVSVNYQNSAGCTALNPAVKNVTINPLPVPTLTGQASSCEGSAGVIYNTEAGMTNYLWATSSGGTITSGSGTNSISVSWFLPGSQSVSVNYTNSNGCTANAATSKSVNVAPLPGAAGTITGNAAVCAGSTGIPYSVAAIANTTTYAWVLPAGATVATGAGTNSITVNFSTAAVPGDITVSGNNSCGTGNPSPAFPVVIYTMPEAAGNISGPGIVCAGTNGAIYSVPPIANAVTYDWTIPAGAVITSGASTNQIMVGFSTTPGTGIFTVKGTNVCGSGTVSPDFNVTMVESQSPPVVTANGGLLTSSIPDGNQWYYEGTGAIPNAVGQTYTATVTGWYWTSILGVGCPVLESNHVYVLFDGQDELQNKAPRIYPVPNEGRFRIAITSPAAEIYTIWVFNQIGARILEINDIRVQGTTEQQIDLTPAVPGLYSVFIFNSEQTVVRKVLVR